MPYLNLHRTNPADVVDPVTQINANWDQIDAGFALLDSGSNPIGYNIGTWPNILEAGIEFSSSGTNPPELGVFQGELVKTINNSQEVWGAWQNLALKTNFISSAADRQAQVRKSTEGRVQVRGSIQYMNGSVAWPGGYQLVNDGQFDNSWAPSQITVQNTTAAPTGSTTWNYGQAYINSSGTNLRIYLMYLGTTLGSGNFINLDSVEWWVF